MPKKVLSALFVLFFLLLAGCSPSASDSPPTDFSADFTAEYNGLSLRGNITTDCRGLLCIEFKSPDTLSGVAVTYKNGEAQLRRDALLCTADEAYLPAGSFPSILKNALYTLGLSESKPKNSTLELEVDGRAYEYSFDEKGNIASINVDNELMIEFSNTEQTG